jgi:riboflavin biosynthesis pyrimidine reductase
VTGTPPISELLPSSRLLSGPEDLEDFYSVPAGSHLRVDFVSSLDGAVELQGRSGPLGGGPDRAAFSAMRAVADVVLVGAGTVRAEAYGPVRLDEDARRRRLRRGQAELPELAVVSARGALDPHARIFGGERRVLVLTSAVAAGAHPELGRVADVVVCGDDRVDLPSALSALAGRGLTRVLCEGGPELTRSLLIAGLVDELCLTFSPVVAGAGHRVLGGDGPLPLPARFSLEGLLHGGGMLLARYRRAA